MYILKIYILLLIVGTLILLGTEVSCTYYTRTYYNQIIDELS